MSVAARRSSALLLLLLLMMAGAGGASEKPNIVLTLVDELGTGDVPWSDASIHAPTLLKLATEGLRLDAAYAWQWCAPTRGALLSGRLPMHSGYAGNTTAQPMNIQPGDPGNGIGMDLRMPLLPGELKRAGFRCHSSCTSSSRYLVLYFLPRYLDPTM